MRNKQLNSLVNDIFKREGKKIKVPIEQVREIVRILIEMETEWHEQKESMTYSVVNLIFNMSLERYKDKQKRKKK